MTITRYKERLVVRRGDTFDDRLFGLGDLSGRSDLWFTVKRDREDTAAQITISETVGLETINEQTAATPANGSITVLNAARGDIRVQLAAVETVKLTPWPCWFDVQMITAAGVVSTLTHGKARIIYDVVNEI